MQVRSSGAALDFRRAVEHAEESLRPQEPTPEATAANLAVVEATVYHAVGRNLVRLQNIERMLRLLLFTSALSGPVSQLAELQRLRGKELKKLGLGELGERYTKEVLQHSAAEEGVPPDVDEIHVSFRFSAGRGTEQIKARRTALKRIVRARNRLAHKLLEDWNRQSVESGQQLLARLEAEDDEAGAEEQILRRDVTLFFTVREEWLRVLESDEIW
jgi:hypothetical protein